MHCGLRRSSSSSSSFLQVFRLEPFKSEGTISCSRKFRIFLSKWHRKWPSPAIILVGLKCHHGEHLENPAKVKPGAASFSTFPVGECAIIVRHLAIRGARQVIIIIIIIIIIFTGFPAGIVKMRWHEQWQQKISKLSVLVASKMDITSYHFGRFEVPL